MKLGTYFINGTVRLFRIRNQLLHQLCVVNETELELWKYDIIGLMREK